MMAELEDEMDRVEQLNDRAPPFVPGTSNKFSNHRSATGSYLPPGAVPSQNGVLSPQAAEFWFPESRNCPCCNGYKHGCSCRSRGVTTCQDPNCTTTRATESIPAPSQETSDMATYQASYSSNSKVCLNILMMIIYFHLLYLVVLASCFWFLSSSRCCTFSKRSVITTSC